MNINLKRGVIVLAIVAGTGLGTACGGSRQAEPISAETLATTQLASLRIGGMT